MGHEVEVVTAAPNYPDGILYPGFRNSLFSRETVDGIEVVRIWTFLAANKGFLMRSLSFISYLVSATLQSFRLRKPDLVLSSSPQMLAGLAGYPVSRLKRVPWVLEIRDLWPESIVTVGAARRGKLIGFLEVLERFAYRSAAHIVPVSKGFLPHIQTCGIPASKLTVLTNGANLSLFAERKENPALAAELGLSGKFVAAYCGTLGMAHALETVLDAAEILRSRDDIRILIVGGGAEQERLHERRDAKGLTNVIMLDRQPRERMPDIWGLADACIVHLRNTTLYRTVIPSKMFEAMALGLPIVLGVHGEAESIMADAQCGLVAEPEDAASVASVIARLADDPDLAKSMGANGRRAVERDYNRICIAKRYGELLQRVAANGRTV
jgi:glycosyltransferase involved in cell wall biosynthesis